MLRNGAVSHWFPQLPDPRPALPGDRDADVCIVGAGYTGLWTAYYLKQLDPALRITVLEARFAGFGASGRNGGWLSGLPPGHRGVLAKARGTDSVIAWQRALNDSVDEVIDVAAREGIDADIVKGGNLEVARTPAQAKRLRTVVDEDRSWGVDGIEILTAEESEARIRVDSTVLSAFNPHCARVQPAKLVRGLADVVERLGVTIYEQTPVTEIAPGRADTPHGALRAPVILRATEGFTARMRGLRRRWLPMNSAMIATEPLPAEVWDAIGWDGCETLGDLAHGFFYAQRTADGRIAIGGRAVPYRYASRIDNDGAVGQDTIDYLTHVLHTVLPQTRGVPIAHGWCGVLAVPRDWTATVRFDAATGLGEAGGYVGHG
ncbi:MAG: FAD-dependent oxidoreductase, partial [Mycobacterium sp.]|nr:FAD-dependent oxidoreductase [Mycobacterium sp.]